MRGAVAIIMLLAVACGGAKLHAANFDPDKGTATLAFGPKSDADRKHATHGLTLVSLRDVGGRELIERTRGERGRCTPATVELNPGRYAVVVQRCAASCASNLAEFAFTLEAKAGHDYRVELDRPLVSLALLRNEWEAFLIDETADTSRSIGKSLERCN